MRIRSGLISIVVIWLSIFRLTAQSTADLEKALIEIATTHELSIVFNPSSLPEIAVPTVDKTWSAEKKLRTILRQTNLEFKIDNSEIVLFQRHRIYGYIEDKNTGERLIAAYIFIPSTGDYAVANEQGYYNFSTINDTLKIIVSYLGYAKKEIVIDKTHMDTPMTIMMSIDNTIDEIVISDALFSSLEQTLLDLEKANSVLLYQNSSSTAVGGEPDLFQAILRQTGVTSGTDGVGGMHVRGGKSGHNQVLLDGMKLHYPNHSFGLYSIINNSVIDQATLYKSGTAGIYSGSTASILDVKSKDPILNSFKAFAQFSSIATQGGLNVPLGKKVAINAVGRVTHLDPLVTELSSAAKAQNGNDGLSNLYFNDYNVKLKWNVNNRLKLYGSIFTSLDGYVDFNEFQIDLQDPLDDLYSGDVSQESTYLWRNTMSQLRAQYILTNRTFLQTSVSYYSYKYFSMASQDFMGTNENIGRSYYEQDLIEFESGLGSLQGKINFETEYEKSSLNYGIQLLQRSYNLGLYSQDIIGETEDPYSPLPEREIADFLIGDRLATEATMYYVHEWQPTGNTFWEGGIYATYLNSRDREDDFYGYDPDLLFNYGGVQGYIKGTYQLSDFVIGGIRGGTSIQTEHLLSPADNSYPNDIWIPATSSARPQRTYQAEVFSSIKKDAHSLMLTAYAKQTFGVSLISTFPPILTLSEFLSDEWEKDLLAGSLFSYGLEASYGFQGKNWDFLANYSYTYADYLFEELNEGIPFAYDFSIPHTLSLRSQVKLSRRWTCALDWYYANGKAFTLYESYFRYQPLDRGIELEVQPISGYNDYRLTSNHKLSISFAVHWNWGKIRSDFSLGLQNIYNRQNAIYAYSIEGQIESFDGFPILPLLKYRISL